MATPRVCRWGWAGLVVAGILAARGAAAQGLVGITTCCPNDFVQIDQATGALATLNTVGGATSGFALMPAVDSVAHKFYTVRITNGVPHVASISTQTGALVESPPLAQNIFALGFDSASSTLVGITACCPNDFVRVDPTTGALTKLGTVGNATVGFVPTPAVDSVAHKFYIVRSTNAVPHVASISTQTGTLVESPPLAQNIFALGFDSASSTLVGITACCPNDFVRVDPTTGALTKLGTVGDATVGFIPSPAVDSVAHNFYIARVTGGVTRVAAISTGTGALVESPPLTQDIFTLGIDPPCVSLALSGTIFLPGTVGVEYPVTTITETGGVGRVTFAVTSGLLPNGLTLSSAGVVSGTPKLPGTFTFIVTATGANGCAGTHVYTVTIAPVAGCVYTIGPWAAVFGAAGGTGAVVIYAPPGCAWPVTNVPAWVSTIAGTSGSGNGAWQYAVAANAGALRSQTVTVAGQAFGLTQLAVSLTSLMPGTGRTVPLADAADTQWLALDGVAGRSYCAEVAPAPTSISAATPTLTAFRADSTTGLAGGGAGTRRACFAAPASETVLFQVTQPEASSRAYRLRATETTLWADWFFIGGTYSSYTLLRNTTTAPVTATITWRADTGVATGTLTVAVPAGGVVFYDALTATNGVPTGSVEVAHDGEPQALVGSQTTLSPATGLSFDTVMFQRRNW